MLIPVAHSCHLSGCEKNKNWVNRSPEAYLFVSREIFIFFSVSPVKMHVQQSFNRIARNIIGLAGCPLLNSLFDCVGRCQSIWFLNGTENGHHIDSVVSDAYAKWECVSSLLLLLFISIFTTSLSLIFISVFCVRFIFFVSFFCCVVLAHAIYISNARNYLWGAANNLLSAIHSI